MVAAGGFGPFRLDVEAGRPCFGVRSLFASGAGPRSSFACWQNGPGFQSPSKTLLQAAWPGLSVETDTMRLWLSFDGASYEAAARADEVIE